jgi:hypothetical protein
MAQRDHPESAATHGPGTRHQSAPSSEAAPASGPRRIHIPTAAVRAAEAGARRIHIPSHSSFARAQQPMNPLTVAAGDVMITIQVKSGR